LGEENKSTIKWKENFLRRVIIIIERFIKTNKIKEDRILKYV